MKKGLTREWLLRIAFLCLTAIIAIAVGVSASKAKQAAANREGIYTPGTYTATADGFGGPVEVAITVGDKGGITNVDIKGDSETPDVGGKAIPVLAQAIMTAQSADVDAVSSATYTSQAVQKAAATALAQAGGAEVVPDGPRAPEGTLFIPGTYTGSSKGFGGDVEVTVTVSENSIDDIVINGDHETENIGSFAVSMLGEKILAAQTPKVDVLTGATVTSNAILRALNDALTRAGANMGALPDARDTGAAGITGDGIVMAQAVGADLVDIDQIQLHPTVEQGTSMLITESVRGDGAILVNQEGKRFTDELLTRDKVSAAELAQPGSYAYIIFDQHLRDGLKAIEKYVSTGITVQADTIEGLAQQLGIDPATLAETLKTWNQYVADKNDPDFGRNTGMDADLSQAPYYAIKIAPGIHHTMGGVKINTNAEVINTDGKVIPGLFAAGEVTGGVHGGNRLGGNAVADIVVFGKIAAASAVEYVNK